MTHPPVALAHLLDLPAGDAWGGLVLLHGVGSRALARFRHPASRLQVTPGGDHRSVQHDPAAQAAALEWLAR